MADPAPTSPASQPSQPSRGVSTPAGSVTAHDPTRFEPVAGLLACLFPGLGYIYFGEFLRAAYVAIGVLGLYVGGLLVGGISIIDKKEDQWWFLLQCGVGPTTLALNQVNAAYKAKTAGGPNPTVTDYQRSLGRVYEVGALSAGMAGMMNLIAIVDCFWHTPSTRKRRDERRPVKL